MNKGLAAKPRPLYLALMAFLPGPRQFARAWADLRQFVAQRRRHEMVFAAAAVALTIGMAFTIFDSLSVKKEWKPPEVQYVEQWPLNRTDAEAHAQQVRDAPRELAEKKAEADAKLKRREAFQRLAKRLGI